MRECGSFWTICEIYTARKFRIRIRLCLTVSSILCESLFPIALTNNPTPGLRFLLSTFPLFRGFLPLLKEKNDGLILIPRHHSILKLNAFFIPTSRMSTAVFWVFVSKFTNFFSHKFVNRLIVDALLFILYHPEQAKGHDFLIQRKIIVCSKRYYSLCKKSFHPAVFRSCLALLSGKRIWIFYMFCKVKFVYSLTDLCKNYSAN